MVLSDVPLDRVNEGHILSLIDNAVRESALLDYKRDTYGDKSPECASDVCAFANGRGGDLVIGVHEVGGEAIAITPFQGDADNEILRLEQMVRDGSEPRLTGLSLRAIPMTGGGHVIIIRVRKSFAGPHRAKVNKNRFFVRSSGGRYEPDVAELRRLFIEAPQLVEQVRTFRGERIARMLAHDTPAPMARHAILLTHVISLPAFADRRLTEVVDVISNATHMPLPPTGVGPNTARVNLDGLLTYPETVQPEVRGYAQLFRNGVLEGAWTPTYERVNVMHGPALANTIVATIKQHADTLKALDAGAPTYAFVTLCNMRGVGILTSATGLVGSEYVTPPYTRDVIELPEVQLVETQDETPILLRPILNMLWNAFGVPRCTNYDGQGKWIGVA
jgi:hypothetical protein